MKVPALGSSLLLLLLLSCSVALASSSAEEDQQGLRHWPSGGEHDGDHHYKTTTRESYPHHTTEDYKTTTKEHYPPKTTTKEEYETTTKYYPPKTTTEDYETTTKYYPPKTTTEDYETTTKYYPPKTTTEDYETTTKYYPPKTTTHEHYPPKTTTEDYKTTTKEHYPPKTTTEDYKTTTHEEYKTTTHEHYPPKTTTDDYKTTTKEHYPPKTTTEDYKTTTKYYPPKTTTDDYKTTTKEHYPPKTTTKECHDETTTTKYYPPKTTTDEYKTTSQYYPPKTTTEEHKTTTQYYPPKTTTPECSTTTAQPPKAKMCDFDGLAACRAKGEAKYDRCLERKKAAFASCQSDAQDKFDRCVHSCGQPQRTGPGFAPGEDQQRPGEVDVETYNLRYARCARELDEDKEHCAVQRQVAHAGCKAARECRDLKCLRFIADCEKCPPSTEYPPPSGSYSCPATDFFGPAADFNVFLSGSDYYIYDLDLVSGDIEGRVAVNGGFRVKSFGTAQRYECPDTVEQAKKFNLVVNGKMDYTNGQLFCGSSLAVTSMNNPSLRQEALGAANVRVGAGQTVKSLSGVDFGATAGYLQGVSDYFAKYSAGAHGYFRVAQVTPSELRTLSIPAGDYVQVINIKGDGDINFTGFEIDTKLDPSRVIYNVVGGNKVTISAFGLAGHLLALHSDVILENAHVTGNVYARSLTGSGSGQVNLATCSKTS